MKLENIKLSPFLPLTLRTFFGVYYKFFLIAGLFFIWYSSGKYLVQFPLLFLLFKLVFYYFILNIFFSYGRLLLIYFYQQRNNYPSEHTDGFILGINQLTFFFNHVLFLLLVLWVFGVGPGELITSISFLAVALVITFRENINNFLAGVTLMFSKDFKLGEYVKFGEQRGRINNITLQNLELKTEYGDYIYVPTSIFLNQAVTNISKASTKNFKAEYEFPKLSKKQYLELKSLLKKTLLKQFPKELSQEDNVIVRLEKVEKEKMLVGIEFLLKSYNYKIEDNIRSFSSELILEYSDSFASKKTKKKTKKN
jgi:small-conductance mechanosensitive channel